MSAHNDGGPAFPGKLVGYEVNGNPVTEDGMSLWDYYAGQFAASVMAHSSDFPPAEAAAIAARYADALLAERAKRQEVCDA